MRKSRKSNVASKHNYLQLLFVFAAFALMALAAYFSIGRILQSRLLSGAEELLSSAEANVKAGLSETETTLLNSYYIVQGMVERDASLQEVFDYLTVTTDWMRRWGRGLVDFYGIYGYINGEFLDSIGMNPGEDFVPQRRPWYQTAIRSGNTVAYTAPYIDWHTGDTIVSAVRNIDLPNGDIVGILAVDMNIKWLTEYVGSLSLAADGYGMLISQNMTIMAHPDASFLGSQLQELGGAYEDIARILRNDEDVFARRLRDPNGGSVIVFFKKIFNNWYVGIITPYSQFYQDLNAAAQILAVLGIALSLMLCFILLRISAAKMRADEESKSKSSFLASMSHEIRTPMNAITGMAELLLRGELSDEARTYAQDIKQAGNNLISIINDILDFSKIEAGRLEIVPVKYLLSSLINDTVNIIRMRLVEKPIRFFTNIDKNIPNNLLGDEVRLRQILLNLLSNAVKYSDKGYIGLTITIEKREEEKIWLRMAVEDTGRGIKQEDQLKLFGEFVQVDSGRNRGIEGTGLGLAITKRLCVAMGGDISFKSEYGSGSTFTAIILQTVDSEAPFASLEMPEHRKVLVYEGRSVYAKSICWSLENLKVPYALVNNQNEFAEALNCEEWFYVFSGYNLYNYIKPLMEQPETCYAGGVKPQLALMVEWGTEVYIPNVRFLYLPVQSLSIANILSGRTDVKDNAESSISSGEVRFSLNGTRLLVVDDIVTNLRVADGLLAPYDADVETCTSGAEAIELVKKKNYDIVFMDHMMPGIDGVEATEAIRSLEGDYFKKVPIIALTANAVLGMKEMFIEKGFSDFLAKPIEVLKLDEILVRWIPNEKRKKLDDKKDKRKESAGMPIFPFPHVPGLDSKRGLVLTGGKEASYRTVLSMFCKDAEERMPILKNPPDLDELPMFVTQVHALKSASASIGATELSLEASGLEAAGKARDLDFIKENLGTFSEHLLELIKNISAALGAVLKEKNNDKPIGQEGLPDNVLVTTLHPLLGELETALKSQAASEIDRILDELNQKAPDGKITEVLEQISNEVLMAEFDKALEIVKEVSSGVCREK